MSTTTETSLAQPKQSLLRAFPQLLGKLITVRELGPLLLLLLQIVVFGLTEPAFYSPLNLSNMMAYTPELGIIALGMTLLLTSGEFDLSVGSIFGFSSIVMFTLFNQGVMSLEAAFVVALLIAALNGLINGLMVTKVRISSFLVTIGMALIVRGIALYVTNGFPQRTWKAESPLKNLIAGSFKVGDFTIYSSLLWFILFAIIMHYILVDTRFGNWIRATGGNPSSAQARGVNIDRTKIILFVLTSVLAGFAGIINAFRVASANPNNGTGYELEVIAMTVIGGTLLSGGRGTIIGTIIGVLILRSMRNGIIIIGVPGLAYDAFIGAIILIMMSIHSMIERRMRLEG